MLLNKKEGNISRANVINLTNNLASQAGRQASTSLPPREGSSPTQTGRQAGGLLPSGEGSNQAGCQAGTPQATAHLPSGEGNSSSQATALLPPGEVSNSPSAGSQAGTLLPT